ncbi:MAG: DUF711 family protein [bacterium]
MKKLMGLIISFVLFLNLQACSQNATTPIKPLFRIRTITAGVNLSSASDLGTIKSAVAFLQRAKTKFEAAGYEVQTLRIATQPLPEYLGGQTREEALVGLKKLDRLVSEKNVLLAIGPIITDDRYDRQAAAWAGRLVKETAKVNFSITVASPQRGIHYQSSHTAAEVIRELSRQTPGGVGNFRFTAAANCPANIPFFPAAYHQGPENFAIGLESPPLLQAAFKNAAGMEDAKVKLKALMQSKLAAVEKLALEIADAEQREYTGIDVSPAPGLDASIGEAIETLTQVPFGSVSTLAACAAITDVLKGLDVKECGYSGLMLPVLEDPILATRAAEGRYKVSDLLLYSSVCGAGLDVIPLPGDVSLRKLKVLILDTAALSVKHHKPLSARLFPIPGKKVGDLVEFDNPFLTSSRVMGIE